jgi:hypothetical protein
MRSRVSSFVLATLLAAGCGASPEPDHRVQTHATRGSERAPTDAARSPDELARDPAWQRIPPEGTHVESQSADAGVAAPRCVGACGAEGDACTDARGWHCRCEWQHDLICGGAYRSPNPPVLGWACAPFDPTTDRGDGCPYAAPSAGQACRVASTLACRYAPGCGWSGVDASCVGGRWAVTPFQLPPPP